MGETNECFGAPEAQRELRRLAQGKLKGDEFANSLAEKVLFIGSQQQPLIDEFEFFEEQYLEKTNEFTNYCLEALQLENDLLIEEFCDLVVEEQITLVLGGLPSV